MDDAYNVYEKTKVDCVTAFEIFEHMLAPYNILKALQCKRLIASVPLKLWFASAYWNEHDDWDKHYHEFEVKQFHFLLQKQGGPLKHKNCGLLQIQKNRGAPVFTLFYAPLLHCLLRTQLVFALFKVFFSFSSMRFAMR